MRLQQIHHYSYKHGHLILKITDVAFEDLSWLYLDGEEMTIVLLKLLS